jgi:hypothetical protein
MIRIHLKRDYNGLMSHLKGRFASERHFDVPITDAATVLKPNGEPLGIMITGNQNEWLQESPSPASNAVLQRDSQLARLRQ